ncbi:MAG TPA: hypothetical protein DEB12_07905 [Porphyromonadaceae bacterium]|jgi:hypothetical protein|nr:hypothetical protein [Porphyromonadaceae bacterium]
MKELVISSKRLKKEVLIFVISFAIAFITNIFAIIKFKTPWYEIFTQIGYVLIITLSIYFVVIFVRFIIFLIKKMVQLFKK